MRDKRALVVLGVCFIGITIGATPADAQNATGAPVAATSAEPTSTDAQPDQSNLVHGYFDPATNTFKSGAVTSDAAPVQHYGSVRFLGTVDLNTGIPASATVGAYLAFTSAPNTASINTTLTQSGAHTAAVDVTIPYTWKAPSGTLPINTTVSLSVYVFNSDGSYSKFWTTNLTSNVTLPATNGHTVTVTVAGAL